MEDNQDVYSAKKIIEDELKQIVNQYKKDDYIQKEYDDELEQIFDMQPDGSCDREPNKLAELSVKRIVDTPDQVVYQLLDGSDLQKNAFSNIDRRILFNLRRTEKIMSLPALFDIYTDFKKYPACICVTFKK